MRLQTCQLHCLKFVLLRKAAPGEYLNILNDLMIGDDGIVTVAATLKAVVPPAGYHNMGSIRYVGPEHVS